MQASTGWIEAGTITLDFLLWAEDSLSNAEFKAVLDSWIRWLAQGVDLDDPDALSEEIIKLLRNYEERVYRETPERVERWERVLTIFTEWAREYNSVL